MLSGRQVARGTRAIVVPATGQVYQQALAEGLIDQLVAVGVAVSTPTCGACFGGHMGLLTEGEVALTTTNRNLHGRMGHAGAWVYLANGYVAAAAAVAGEIVDPAAVVGVEQAVRGATGVDEAMATPPGRPLGLKEGHGLAHLSNQSAVGNNGRARSSCAHDLQ